ARGFAQHKDISPSIAIAAVQELHKITGKHKAPETNPADVARADQKQIEFIETYKRIVAARQEQFKHLTITQIIVQVREEMTARGLGGLMKLLPELSSEEVQYAISFDST